MGTYEDLRCKVDMRIASKGLNVSPDLMIAESADTFLEASSGIIETLKNFIETLVQSIVKLFTDLATKIKNKFDEKKINVSPELKKKIQAAKQAGHNYIEGPDIDALKKIVQQSEEFIKKGAIALKSDLKLYASQIKVKKPIKLDEPVKLSNRQAKKLEVKINKLCDSLDIQYAKIEKQFQAELKKNIKIPITKIYDLAKEGSDYVKEIQACGERMSAMISEFTELLTKYRSMFESAGDEFEVYQESSDGEPGFFKRVLNKIEGFIKRHARAMQYICDAIAAICTIGSAARFGDAMYHAGAADMQDTNKEYMTQMYNHTVPEKELRDKLKPIPDNMELVRKELKKQSDADYQKSRYQSSLLAGGAAGSALASRVFKSIADDEEDLKLMRKSLKK